MIGVDPHRLRSAVSLDDGRADTTEFNEPSWTRRASGGLRRRSVRSVAVQGARDITPMTVGVIPLAITIGVVMSTSSLSTVQAISSGPIILAGTSQLAALRLLAADAVPPMIVLSAIMLNVRFVLYSTAFAEWFRDEPLKTRLLLAIPIVDQLYFTCVPRFERGDLDARDRRAYHLGAGIWLYGVWWLSQFAAYAVGPRLLSTADSVAVLAPLALVGLVARSTTGRAASTAAASATVCAWIAAGVPFNGALPLAIMTGIGFGSIRANREAHAATDEDRSP